MFPEKLHRVKQGSGLQSAHEESLDLLACRPAARRYAGRTCDGVSIGLFMVACFRTFCRSRCSNLYRHHDDAGLARRRHPKALEGATDVNEATKEFLGSILQ